LREFIARANEGENSADEEGIRRLEEPGSAITAAQIQQHFGGLKANNTIDEGDDSYEAGAGLKG
jgi:hypothetical protein